MTQPTFGLDIAQQPGPQPSPDFLTVSYLDMSTQGAKGETRPLANAVSLYASNYGGHACLLQVNAGRAVYTFVLDAHSSLAVQLGVVMTALTLTDLTAAHAGQPTMTANDYDVAGNEDTLELAVGAFVAITTSDVPMTIEQRRRPLTLAGTRIFDSIGTQIGAAFDGGSAALPAATLYNPATASRETQRTPTVFKAINSVNLGAGGTATLWPPASGKRFRLLGVHLWSSSAGGLLLLDANQSIVQLPSGSASAAPVLPWGGNGYLCSTINTALTLNGPANAVVGGVVWGTEE